MQYQLKNQELQVTFASLGGEILSVKTRDQVEYIWQGDEAYWSGHAPIMFPICGALREGKAQTRGGKEVCLPRHGFARRREFACEELSEKEIVFSLTSDEETYAAYPYHFTLKVRYTLEGASLSIRYEVVNHGQESLPYFIGNHPAFSCPLLEGETASDYRLEFDEPETILAPACLENGLIDGGDRRALLENDKVFSLDDSLCGMGCIVLDQIRSRHVRLIGPTGRGVALDFPDFSYFILWTASKEAPFIALEPCAGLATYLAESDIFEEKRGVSLLAPQTSQNHYHSIHFF